jgi:hypothetical protein
VSIRWASSTITTQVSSSGSELISSSSSRPFGAQELVGHRERHVRLGLVTTCLQDPGRGQVREEALDQRGLADAGLAFDDDDLRPTGGRVAERIVEYAKLRLTTDEDRCRCRVHDPTLTADTRPARRHRR